MKAKDRRSQRKTTSGRSQREDPSLKRSVEVLREEVRLMSNRLREIEERQS